MESENPFRSVTLLCNVSDTVCRGITHGHAWPTTDHAEIRLWAATHKALPAEIKPLIFDSEPAVLRFLFQGPSIRHSGIETISWDSFFAQFDLMGLALVYEMDESGRSGREHELLQIEAKSAFSQQTYQA